MADIVDTAVGAGSFKTLVAAVQAADLVATLKGKGPFTVFAPTDTAFEKLPAGTVAALLADQPKLTSVLTYHVVPGLVMAADVAKIKSATTVQGQSVSIDTTNGVHIDNATVTQADIVADNGVIHVIDTVLLSRERSRDARLHLLPDQKDRRHGKPLLLLEPETSHSRRGHGTHPERPSPWPP